MPPFRELRNKLPLVIALVCLPCCVTLAQTITTNHAAGINFSKYHTYCWVEVKGQHPDPSVDAQIKKSFDAQLAARGLSKTDGTGDLAVDYQASLRTVQVWQSYEDWTDNTFAGQRFPKKKQVTIEKGELALDIYDTAAKQRVWTGRAFKTLDPNSSPEDRQKSVDSSGDKVVGRLPATVVTESRP